MPDQRKQVAVVTGSASGIGRATAKAFLAKGHVVYGLDRDVHPDMAPDSLHGEWIPCQLDVADERAVRVCFDRIVKEQGGIDTLVTSAAVGFPEDFGSMGVESWDRVFRVNVTGTMLCVQNALRSMIPRKSGSIVIVSSIAGRTKSVSNGSHYTTSKYALIGLTRHVAAELAGSGVRINCVAPGPTNSPILTASSTPAEVAKIVSGTPLRRIAEPENIANVIAFAASTRAKQIHGSILDVNGGLY